MHHHGGPTIRMPSSQRMLHDVTPACRPGSGPRSTTAPSSSTSVACSTVGRAQGSSGRHRGLWPRARCEHCSAVCHGSTAPGGQCCALVLCSGALSAHGALRRSVGAGAGWGLLQKSLQEQCWSLWGYLKREVLVLTLTLTLTHTFTVTLSHIFILTHTALTST